MVAQFNKAVRKFQDECLDLKKAEKVMDCMTGKYVKLSSKEDVDYLVEHLSKYTNHNGVVIAGCNPWFLSTVLRTI